MLESYEQGRFSYFEGNDFLILLFNSQGLGAR